MPSSLQARMMRRAISPRLAIRMRWKFGTARTTSVGSGRIDAEQGLVELDRLAVLDEDLGDGAGDAGRDVGEDLHRLDDADGRIRPDGRTDRDERRGVGPA